MPQHCATSGCETKPTRCIFLRKENGITFNIPVRMCWFVFLCSNSIFLFFTMVLINVFNFTMVTFYVMLADVQITSSRMFSDSLWTFQYRENEDIETPGEMRYLCMYIIHLWWLPCRMKKINIVKVQQYMKMMYFAHFYLTYFLLNMILTSCSCIRVEKFKDNNSAKWSYCNKG